MPKAPLDQLADTLAAIPPADVRKPDLPMAVFNQQGKDLVTFLDENPAVKERLTDVGVPAKVLGQLALAMAAASDAESAWQAVFSPRRPEDLVALEQRAASERSAVVAAARWNLRADRIAQGTLDAIQDGEGTADLAQDLGALAVLLEQRKEAFAKDKTFDVKARAKGCHELAEELRAALSGERADLTRAEAKGQRDRAFTYADGLLGEVRAAARYAFRDEPALLERFRDRYLWRADRRSRTRAAVPAPAAPEPLDA